MRVFELTHADQPPRLVERERPCPDAGEVLVRITACGLNFADLLMAEGTYQDTPPPPFTLGMEVAGEVVSCGTGCAGAFPEGARVVVFGGQGGLAEYGCFPVERVLAVPNAMSMVEAAGFQVAYGTSHLALARRGRLQAGERLVVFGAAGGVGLTAVEIGAQMGAEVIACARGAEKVEIARAAGAHHVIDLSDTGDLRARLLALGGIDVAYDPVGGDVFRAAFRACRPEGRLLVIGFASGNVPPIPANHLMVKNISVEGVYWGGYLAFHPQAVGESLKELLGWYENQRLRPHVSHVLPLERAAEGLELLRQRKSTGKVVITMDS